jgi:selenocysteine lyase/cysteine desulfurase
VLTVTIMRVAIEQKGDYFVVEVYSDDNRLLIRVGFDHEPTEEEIDALLQQLSGGDAAWQS